MKLKYFIMKKKSFFCLLLLGAMVASCFTACKNSERNSVKAVDLGLSVKWADRDLSSSRYAWGELEPKTCFVWSGYRFGVRYDQLTKYCWDSSYGKDGYTDRDVELKKNDDVAHKKLRGKWRIPTEMEWQELRSKCTWSPIAGGIQITGPNGNSIFLSPDGAQQNTIIRSGGPSYWSSTLSSIYPCNAVAIDVSNASMSVDYNRCYGLLIHAVCE